MGPCDNVVVIGIGGVGKYMVQEAKALSAATVVAIDIENERLEKMLSYGADLVINAAGKSAKEIGKEFRSLQLWMKDF